MQADNNGDIFIRLPKDKKVKFIDSYKNVLMIKLVKTKISKLKEGKIK